MTNIRFICAFCCRSVHSDRYRDAGPTICSSTIDDKTHIWLIFSFFRCCCPEKKQSMQSIKRRINVRSSSGNGLHWLEEPLSFFQTIIFHFWKNKLLLFFVRFVSCVIAPIIFSRFIIITKIIISRLWCSLLLSAYDVFDINCTPRWPHVLWD